MDWTFVTTAGPILERLAGTRSRVAFIPNPVDPSIDTHRCHERSDQPYDVFFASSAHKSLDPQDLRARAHELIHEALPQTRCAFFGNDHGRALFGTDFVNTIGQAKIGLNFSQRSAGARSGPGGELYLYSSDRIGLYLGNGLLVFSTSPFELGKLYGEDAIVEVSGEDDFIEKLDYFVRNDSERQKIARAGFELADREFNERLVSQYMIETALGMPHSHTYRWPLERYAR